MTRFWWGLCLGILIGALLAVSYMAFTRPGRPAPPALLGYQPPAHEAGVVGSTSSRIYHRPECGQAGRIPARYRVEFPSPEHADAAGLRQCRRCRPVP